MLRIPLFLTEVQKPRRKRQVQGAKPNRKSRYREKAVLLVGSEQRHNRRTEKFQLVKYDAVDSAWTKCKDTFNRFKEDWGWLPLTTVDQEKQNSKHQHVLRYIDIAKLSLVQFNPWLVGLVFIQSPVPTGKFGEL